MKRILFFLMAFAVAAGMTGCGDDKSTDPTPGPGPTPDPDPEPTPEETYSIGDYYEKGFVSRVSSSASMRRASTATSSHWRRPPPYGPTSTRT